MEILGRHAKTFRWAALFLSKQQRRDSAVAYAFCRLVDDTVDEAESVESARLQLAHLRAMLLGEVQPSGIVEAYLEVSMRCGIGPKPAHDLLAGAGSDLELVRFRDEDQLMRYCYLVAGTVGLMMCGILGVRSARARALAVDLGMAMQLTNICRDVREDSLRNRVYLPAELPALPSESPQVQRERQDRLVHSLTRQEGPHFDIDTRTWVKNSVRYLLRQADRLYASGASGFRFLPRRPRLAIAIASRLYRHIGIKLLADTDGDPLDGRCSVGWLQKVRLTAVACLHWALRSRSTPHPSTLPPTPFFPAP